jgi:predicted Zn-dependent peptidase
VFFANYDMVQTEMILISKGPRFSKELMASANLFNEYFGGGLSSIIFQEIREQKALAYSAYSYFSTPRKKDESHYVVAYIGTQADKLPQAVDAMSALMNEMPVVENQFNASKDAALKIIESERIVGSAIFWNYESVKRRGFDYDIRKDVYETMKATGMDGLKQFFDAHIKGKQYNYLVLGKKGSLDTKSLMKWGPVEELSLETLFNY